MSECTYSLMEVGIAYGIGIGIGFGFVFLLANEWKKAGKDYRDENGKVGRDSKGRFTSKKKR